MIHPRVVLIAGPTASGKSALALSLAEHIGRAVIINADSMQVYSDLHILTARPTVEDEARVPHRLFGHVPGTRAYSVASFAADCRLALDEARKRDAVAIIVGGTGLYFKALIEGLSPIPAIPDEVRQHCRSEAARVGPAELHAALASKDPVMAARLVPTDTQRITRALEVVLATGKSLSAWQQVPGVPVVEPSQTARFVLMPEREIMMARCDTRFDAMIRDNVLDEVANLRAMKLADDLPVMRALGVRPLIEHLEGRLPLDAAVALAKTETRQFAKRQITWLRRHMISWITLSAQETTRNSDQIISFIDF
jgi:tRNA dimethylallyltransferase